MMKYLKRTLAIALILYPLAYPGYLWCQNKENVSLLSKTNSDLLVTPLVGIGPVRFGMTKQEVIEKFGEPEYTEYGGLGMAYLSKGFSVVLQPKIGLWQISCFTKTTMLPNLRSKVNDFKGKTKEGIGVGDTEAQIIEVYGIPDTKTANGHQTQLTYEKLKLIFLLLSDRLIQFSIGASR